MVENIDYYVKQLLVKELPDLSQQINEDLLASYQEVANDELSEWIKKHLVNMLVKNDDVLRKALLVPITLRFHHVNVYDTISKGKRIEILKDLNGVFRAGKMHLLVGPPHR